MSKRAFTYIELSVVILVLVLLAALVAPSMRSLVQSERYRESVRTLRDLGARASQAAIEQGATQVVSYDDGGDELLVGPLGEDGVDPERAVPVALPEGMEATQFVSGRHVVGPTDWRIQFYPDGTNDGGGLELLAGSEPMSLRFDPTSGRSRLERGSLPEPQTERWQAGEIEQRA